MLVSITSTLGDLLARKKRNTRTPLILLIALGAILAGAVAFGFVQNSATLAANAQAAREYVPEPIAPPPPPVHVIAVLGDSMTAGSKNEVLWPNVTSKELGVKVLLKATGGSAYTQERKPLIDQAKDAAKLQPSVVIIAGSINDRKSAPEAISAAASEVYAYLKQALPNSRVAIVGPFWDIAPVPGVHEANAAIKSAAESAGLPFWDAISEGWLPDPSLIQEDGLHPTDAAQQLLGEKMAAKITESGILATPPVISS